METPFKERLDPHKNLSSIDLMWTGGFDSTFRLLQLLLVENKQTQPYYIVDENRKSTEFELKAMNSIREELPEKAKALLQPTILSYKKEIKPNSTITQKYESMRSKLGLGTQYDWLARYADQNGFNDLEICFEKTVPPLAFDKWFYYEIIGEGHQCRIKDNLTYEEMSIFKYFRFPIAHLTKVEMEEISKKNNFFKILKLSWFCHTPKKNGEPCETCQPCKLARKSGYSHGLPKTNLFRDLYIQFVSKVSSVPEIIRRKLS